MISPILIETARPAHQVAGGEIIVGLDLHQLFQSPDIVVNVGKDEHACHFRIINSSNIPCRIPLSPSINSWLEDELSSSIRTTVKPWTHLEDCSTATATQPWQAPVARAAPAPRPAQARRTARADRRRRSTGPSARARAAHRREHDGEPDHARRHQPARRCR